MQRNLIAFLAMLRFSEGTSTSRATQSNGYDVIVTGMDGKPEVFTDYSDHPFAKGRPGKVFNKRGDRSTASGAYQQLYKYWPHYKALLQLPDFSPASQDKLAICLITEQRAYDDVISGRIESAIDKCRNIWASLPGAGYGQAERDIVQLLKAYKSAGGVLAE